MPRPMPRAAVNLGAWLVGAVVSVTVGVVALSRIDAGLAGGGMQPLSPDSVTRGMTEVPPATPADPRATSRSASDPAVRNPSVTAVPPSTAASRPVRTSGPSPRGVARPSPDAPTAWFI